MFHKRYGKGYKTKCRNKNEVVATVRRNSCKAKTDKLGWLIFELSHCMPDACTMVSEGKIKSHLLDFW